MSHRSQNSKHCEVLEEANEPSWKPSIFKSPRRFLCSYQFILGLDFSSSSADKLQLARCAGLRLKARLGVEPAADLAEATPTHPGRGAGRRALAIGGCWTRSRAVNTMTEPGTSDVGPVFLLEQSRDSVDASVQEKGGRQDEKGSRSRSVRFIPHQDSQRCRGLNKNITSSPRT